MKMNRRQAFTLPELLIGMLLILIVLGGVVATLKSGLDVYSGSEANGKVTTGVRFTVASFKSEILPMVNAASNIEILKDAGSIPSAISGSGDYYIYRSTDSTVKCRSAAGDISLNGSEYISSLDFSVPKSSADKLENYLLNMHIEGQDPKYQTAYVSIDVAMASPWRWSAGRKSLLRAARLAATMQAAVYIFPLSRSPISRSATPPRITKF